MTAIADKKPECQELKKHVGLIHSSNKLSLIERKVANALLFSAYHELKTQEEHSINIRDLSELIGFSSNNIEVLKKALRSLMSTVLEWNIIEEQGQERGSVWGASTMLAGVEIKGSHCSYSYSPQMRRLCHYPEMYGRLNMKIMSSFKSSYALALYENCIRYQRLPHTPWLDLSTYRKLMGIPPEKYLAFKDLNKRVTKVAVKEVNNRSPISIEPEFKTKGRAVEAIRFRISKNKAEPEGLASDESLSCLLRKNHGFSDEQAKAVLKTHGEDYIKEKMDIVEATPAYKEGKISYPSLYLQKAIDANYQSAEENRVKKSSSDLSFADDVKKKEVVNDKYRKYAIPEILREFESLPPREKSKIHKDFEAYISKTVWKASYIAKGLDDILVQDHFVIYLRKSFPHIIRKIVSLEEFCAREGF